LEQLKDAGLVDVARGTGSASLVRKITGITLLDVYGAVESSLKRIKLSAVVNDLDLLYRKRTRRLDSFVFIHDRLCSVASGAFGEKIIFTISSFSLDLELTPVCTFYA
jgi:Predicted transcriptional regulator